MAFGLGLKIRQLVLGLGGLGPDLAQAHLELLDGGARGIDFGFGFGQRQLVGRGIETQQHVAGRDHGVVADAHVDDAARHFAGDLGDVGLDERVLGRGVAAALQPDDQRAEQDEHGHADQRQWPQPLAHGAALPLRPRAPREPACVRQPRRCAAGASSHPPKPGSVLMRCNNAISCLLSGAERSASASSTVVFGDAPDALVHPLGFRREIDPLDAAVVALRCGVQPSHWPPAGRSSGRRSPFPPPSSRQARNARRRDAGAGGSAPAIAPG